MNEMSMKKISAVILAAAMVLGTMPMAVSANVEEETEASKSIKVGMVTDSGGVNDQSFNQSAWEGLEALAEENDAIEVNYLESATDADYASNIQTFIDDGYDLIICGGFMLASATREAAEANPDQKFAIVDDASNADLPNVACLMFSQEQASYLVGVVAGMMTKTKKVGYVQGVVTDTMNLFGYGYIAGVHSVDPDIEVMQFNVNSFTDPATASAGATDMITNGADIIYQAAGGSGAGVIQACVDNGIYAIGVDTDQSYLAPETIITSAMKRVDNAVISISKGVLAGEFAGGVHQYGLEDGGVDIAPTQDLLPDDVIAAVEAAKESILSGDIVVPTTAEECPDFVLE